MTKKTMMMALAAFALATGIVTAHNIDAKSTKALLEAGQVDANALTDEEALAMARAVNAPASACTNAGLARVWLAGRNGQKVLSTDKEKADYFKAFSQDLAAAAKEEFAVAAELTKAGQTYLSNGHSVTPQISKAIADCDRVIKTGRALAQRGVDLCDSDSRLADLIGPALDRFEDELAKLVQINRRAKANLGLGSDDQ